MRAAITTPITPPRPAQDARGWRWLHRSYAVGAGASHAARMRISPAGVCVGVVMVVAGSLAMGQPRESVLGVCALTGGLAVTAVLGALLRRRPALAVTREIPRYATAGEPLEFTATVRNAGTRAVRRAWLCEMPPDPRPSLAEFASLPEPGESARNAFDRKFAYYRWQWLVAGKTRFTDGAADTEVRLARGAAMSVKFRITPLRRGVIPLRDLRVLLPDPLTLVQRSRRLPAPAATVTVLPRRYALPPVELAGTARFLTGGETTSNAIGQDGEFVGLRDYRPGDPLRQIHWRSWARTGRPIVKELEHTHFPRYGLVVDTFADGTDPEVFEEVLSVAASFAVAIDTRESLLDMMFVKDRALVVTAGRGLARADVLLEALAGVEAEPVADFEKLLGLVLRHRDELNECVVVLAGWDPGRQSFLQRMAAGGVRAVPLVVGRGGPPAGLPGHWLECGEVARDLRRLPPRLHPLI